MQEVKMQSKSLLGIILFVMMCAVPDVWGADWRYCGGTPTSTGKYDVTFYDTETVRYSSNGNAQVWVKAIKDTELERVMGKREKVIVEASAKKVAAGYIPPYCLVNKKADYNASIDIISWEEVANNDEGKHRAMFLFEINCTNKMVRYLSGHVYDGSKIISNYDPGKWDYIVPDSTGENLSKILCKTQSR